MQSQHFELLDYLQAWARDVTRSGPPPGGDLTFERTRDDRPKPAAHVTLSADGRHVDLIVWSSGEAELAMGFPGDPRVNEHHQLSSTDQLDGLLDRISAWLRPGGDIAP